MLGSKHQVSINMQRKANENRITFAQLTWPGLMLVAGIVAAIKGTPIWLAVLLVLVACLPVLVWAVIKPTSRASERAMEDFYIAAWTLVSLVAMAIGGGALSPLTAMLVLGPLGAFMLGRAGLAIDMSIVGLMVYAVSIAAGAMGWADLAPPGWRAIVAPWAIACLVQIVVFLWACEPLLAGTMETEQIPQADHTLPETKKPDLAAVASGLDLTLPLALVHISPEGRIRRVEGASSLRWPGLAVGQIADKALCLGDAHMYTAPNGEAFRVLRRADSSGAMWVGLLPNADDTVQHATGPATNLETELEQARSELADRTAFFAGLGHELKTPLNAVLGFSDLMKAEIRGPLPDAYKDYPAIIHESGQDLMLLVEDILDLAKAEASGHQLDLEPVDLVASAASVVRQLADQAERAGVRLALEEAEEVWAEADARAVRQIWQNLISNAIKYSEKGGIVTVAGGKVSGAVAMSVRDRGAGMDKSDLERIAKPFAQGANSKGRVGTGLGLAVVHKFAELHGGKVIIDTAPGKGTRVRVTLPAADMAGLQSLGDAAQ